MPYHFVVTVVGHKGELIFGTIEGEQVMCFRGRFHSYEGHDIKLVSAPFAHAHAHYDDQV